MGNVSEPVEAMIIRRGQELVVALEPAENGSAELRIGDVSSDVVTPAALLILSSTIEHPDQFFSMQQLNRISGMRTRATHYAATTGGINNFSVNACGEPLLTERYLAMGRGSRFGGIVLESMCANGDGGSGADDDEKRRQEARAALIMARQPSVKAATSWVLRHKEIESPLYKQLALELWSVTEVLVLKELIELGGNPCTIPELTESLRSKYSDMAEIEDSGVVGAIMKVWARKKYTQFSPYFHVMRRTDADDVASRIFWYARPNKTTDEVITELKQQA